MATTEKKMLTSNLGSGHTNIHFSSIKTLGIFETFGDILKGKDSEKKGQGFNFPLKAILWHCQISQAYEKVLSK